jgi:protein-S-isoprenylcysteine O-methyltransferase Ste14
MTTRGNRARTDLGRIIMVPVSAAILVIDLIMLIRHGGASPLRYTATATTCVFYAVIIWCYARRGPAAASSRSVTAHVAAVAATCAPFVFPLLTAASPGETLQIGADVLLIAGTAWAVWSLRFLGRNLSVIAQARDVVDSGPYRWVRHPLYAGEIVSSLGLALTVGSLSAIGVWAALCLLQAYRAISEEQVLLDALPGYREYRSRTAALLPSVF